MKVLLLLLPLLIGQAQQAPKNDPNGIWKSTDPELSDSRYEIRLSGSDLTVKLVPGSNPKFLEYEVNMKNEKEVNTYKGTGFMVAKMNGGKECKLPVQWLFVVLTKDRLIGEATQLTADSKTCAVREQIQVKLDLTRDK